MTKKIDPAVAAWRRARGKYDRAIADFETAFRATPPKGPRIVFRRNRRRIEYVAVGDIPSDNLVEHLQTVGALIDKALKQIAARTMA